MMGKCRNNNSSVISLHLLLLILFTTNIILTKEDSILGDLVCNLKPCGQAEQGTCQPTDVFPFFECVCNPGWKKIQLGPFSSCLLPNCTIDFGCGNGIPPQPRPPPTDGACAYVWCGDDGSCVANGNGSTECHCNPGSSNLFNMPTFACFKQCYLGSDCKGVHLGPPPSQPSPNTSGSTANGSAGPLANSSALGNLCASVLTLLAATFLTWI